MNMFNTVKKLKEHYVLGINHRNINYIFRYNSRKLYPLVDDKFLTKNLMVKANIAVPKLYALIQIHYQLKTLPQLLSPYNDFVIKPAHGSGGNGILVINGRIKENFCQANGERISHQALAYHISNILSGSYSLGGHPDKALIEYRVKVNSVFDTISYQGVPDIRVITLLGFPAMAMVRLPTHLSGGKANLHQGAIGVGIDLVTGKTKGGVWFNETVDYHPDTKSKIAELQIPHWDKILKLAASCYELTGLGYIGVDIVLDKNRGPFILELNARPGLNIQIANREGLLDRCQLIESQADKGWTPKERINFSKNQFRS